MNTLRNRHCTVILSFVLMHSSDRLYLFILLYDCSILAISSTIARIGTLHTYLELKSTAKYIVSRESHLNC